MDMCTSPNVSWKNVGWELNERFEKSVDFDSGRGFLKKQRQG